MQWRTHKRARRSGARWRRALFEPLEARTPLAADITTGLVHHWTFDETSGDTATDSAGASAGTLVGWGASEAKWVGGRVGGALRFDTADNYVMATPPAMSGSYAVSFWLNMKDRSGVGPRIFSLRAGSQIAVNFYDGRGVSFYSPPSRDAIADPDPPTFNTWEHYAVNFNVATGQGVIYRSGAPVAIGNYNDSASLTNWIIGHHEDLGNNVDSIRGALDDLRVYSRLLTDEDIAALASLGVAEPTHVEPVHHWTFDETTGFTAFDTAGNADGILLNWNQTEPRWEPGIVGGALRFSTADNAVVTPAIATGAVWTTAFWLNVQSRSGINPRVLEPWAYINLENNRGIGFTSRNQHTFDPTPVALDKWEHYAITYDTISNVGTIYRNGVAVKSGPYLDNAPASSWVFGHQSGDLGNHNDSLDGLLDDLRQYDRLLSPSEIRTLAGQVNPLPPTAGLIHHWTFDETTGNVAVDVVGGNDGELRNYGATQAKWVPGKIGGAVSFTDGDDLVITEMPITEDKYTFSFWLNQTGDGGFNPRLINPGDEDWLVLWQFANRGITFSDSQVWDPRTATRNVWEHYAVTLDQTTDRVEFYRSGVLVAAGSYPNKPPPIKQWVMGHSGTLTHHVDTLHGQLDEMRVYDRVLSYSEIQVLAGNPLPQPPTAGLIHHWTFDETTGNVAADVVGGNDGELRNFSATQQTWVPGKIGNAVRFSEGNDLILTEAAITYDQYTMSFWLNQTGEGGFNPRVVGIRDSLEEWIVIAQTANKGICMGPCDPQLPKRGVWEHYSLTFDQPTDQVNIYRNGLLVASGSFLRPSPLAQWIFGHNADLNRHVDTLHGMLDEFRVYNRLLSVSEVQILANYQPLEARADAYSTREDTELFVSGPLGVMNNDGTGGSGTRAVIDTLPTRGQVVLNDDGSFTYTPNQDFNGTDSFTYYLELGSEVSSPATVSLTITPVNDAPSFVAGADRFVDDESGSRAIHHWASQVSAGPADEAGQTLTFTAVADQPELLAVQPQIVLVDGTFGRLTYTLARNKIGVVTVTVTVKDSGGTADGGVDTSPAQTFKINIAKKNPGHNSVNARDVTNDGMVGASDALAIINFINAFGIGPVPAANVNAPPYYDVVPDDVVSSSDALEIINYINANPRGSVDFLGTDATTQGNWIGKYGSQGYSINSGPKDLPSYATLSFSNLYNVVWDDSTTDERALELPEGSGRLASAWTGNNPENPDRLNGMIFHLSLTDGQFHRVTIYAIDWDTHNRRQKIEILDATTDEVLDTRLAEPFSDGLYYSWILQGGVKIRFTNLANGLNTVASGVFFD